MGEKNIDKNYILIYVGNGDFNIKFENDEIKKAGPNLRGIVRYTYFENYDLPEIGWSIDRIKLFNDYFVKVINDINNDINNGKIKIK